ncbi:mRNA turnover protein 4 [Nematocida major]|uniref:mRNA turnover protein 4 n=1 Tax=Nematocida major TaxID=1912982 RepID=UPI0020077E36|nr:mRNA turnover protein 4 [Nematocida major]KAH9387495.1 mRNA turnover protein 4 [Nematocida major]
MRGDTQRAKREKVDGLLSNIDSYQSIFKILCDNKTAFVQKLKRDFRSLKSELFFGKYRMVEKVLSRKFDSEQMRSIAGTISYKKSDKVFLFLLSDLPVERVKEILAKVSHLDYERKGETLSQDMVIPAGELLTKEGGKVSNTLFKEITKLGLEGFAINSKTNGIEAEKEIVVARKGEAVTETVERMAKILGVKTREHAAVLVGHAEIRK